MEEKKYSKKNPNIKCIKCGSTDAGDESFWSEKSMQSYFFLVCDCGHEVDIPIDDNGNPMIDYYSKKDYTKYAAEIELLNSIN